MLIPMSIVGIGFLFVANKTKKKKTSTYTVGMIIL